MFSSHLQDIVYFTDDIMDHKYDPEDIPDNANIAKEWNDCWKKIPEKQNEYKDQNGSKMTNGHLVITEWNNECEQNISKKLDSERWNRDKKGLKFENNTNTENAIIGNHEEFKVDKQFESVKWNKDLEIPGLLINISRKCSLALSSFQILSDTFQQYYTQCCDTFHICHNDLTMETSEQCAALTYAIIRLLFHIGYNPERITVSGIDTLMMLAAKDAMKLDDACFAWKAIKSLINIDGDNSMMNAKQINEILSKLDINFENAISLINVQQLILSNTQSLIAAILTSEEQNQQFLNDQLKSYMVFGSSTNNCQMKHIEKFDDFKTFITFQKDFKLLNALQKALIEKKTVTNLPLKKQFYQWKKIINEK
ncbi:hypothetical protein WUBG_14144 [Wuchereria bancrofti]|uniref:Uncharacterized protein n=1 Tax=Wuchereria bancrofti TaxID=6293 RepID=J9EHS0_WUCBA|nr:hypothetical protein WUBG_14144 [Wuchereria bancrofti]